MNPLIDTLQPYPFEKLAALKSDIKPNPELSPIAWSIGEPKHSPPAFVLKTLSDNIAKIGQYPLTKGLPELRETMVDWASKRFQLNKNSLDAEKNILPVNGTREALFAFAQAMIDPSSKPLVMLPNPFYQIYEGAALLAGAEPYYLDCPEENHFLPELESISEADWQRCQLFYLCSPNNPTGAIYSQNDYQKLIELADRYNFIIASDECYSEIYPDENIAPTGLLQTCATLGRDDFKRCIVFHSLSKRSNLPGLRSGFVAGDATVIEQFLRYRTYHGCAMSTPIQLASIAAWQDEEHVKANRILYREKFSQVCDILKDHWQLTPPQAGFTLWAKTPIDDQIFTQRLFEKQHITVLPGSYLSREVNGQNPGNGFVRMALVAPVDECIEAAQRIKQFFIDGL